MSYHKGSLNPPRGYVYLVRATSTDFCKIGATRTIQQRLVDLQVSSPHRLELVACLETNAHQHVEKCVHSLVAATWEHGEWFHLSDERLAAVVHMFEAMAAVASGGSFRDLRRPQHECAEPEPPLPSPPAPTGPSIAEVLLRHRGSLMRAVIEELGRRGACYPRDVATAIGRSDSSVGIMLKRLSDRGEIRRLAWGVYAPFDAAIPGLVLSPTTPRKRAAGALR